MTKYPLIILILLSGLTMPTARTLAAGKQAVFTTTHGDQEFTINASEMSLWRSQSVVAVRPAYQLEPPSLKQLLYAAAGQADQAGPVSRYYAFDASAVSDFVSLAANTINQPPAEPSLTIKNNEATEFTPPREGVYVDTRASAEKILQALERGEKTAELSVSTTSPRTSLGSLNTMGIQELIAEGVSTFKGSPSNRRFNINVGMNKIKGAIVPQGATFSFNERLGPVDGEHGFKPELVIKASGTVPEFGGGLCQVSSTTFRAAMQAGLPIKERRNHSYAVQYYAPQGTDATIYPGVVDLKFVNDTPGAILIWPYLKDKDTLVFDFYGTKDNRDVVLEKPVQWDRKTDGSMKASWTRIVTKDGTASTSTFKSVYQPPALFHKQETFPANIAPAPQAPTSTSTGVTIPATQN